MHSSICLEHDANPRLTAYNERRGHCPGGDPIAMGMYAFIIRSILSGVCAASRGIGWPSRARCGLHVARLITSTRRAAGWISWALGGRDGLSQVFSQTILGDCGRFTALR